MERRRRWAGGGVHWNSMDSESRLMVELSSRSLAGWPKSDPKWFISCTLLLFENNCSESSSRSNSVQSSADKSSSSFRSVNHLPCWNACVLADGATSNHNPCCCDCVGAGAGVALLGEEPTPNRGGARSFEAASSAACSAATCALSFASSWVLRRWSHCLASSHVMFLSSSVNNEMCFAEQFAQLSSM